MSEVTSQSQKDISIDSIVTQTTLQLDTNAKAGASIEHIVQQGHNHLKDDNKPNIDDDDADTSIETKLTESETPYSPSQAPTPSASGDLVKRSMDVKVEDESETPRPSKKSRKLQGAGVKKPLYTRYESLFIIKAYKTILDHQPNLVLIDLFKIVAILFNEEAKRQGFKERTPDQLYQKYKRIQHGLNHGELEFLKFFKQNKYNLKEWIPNFKKVGEDEEDPLKFIKFPRLHDAMSEILGKDHISDEAMELEEDNESQNSDPEDQLLKLAGYDENNDDGNETAKKLINELKIKVAYLEERLKFKDDELLGLRASNTHQEREIEFLKNMVKEDLSYIRHKVKSIKE